MGLIEQMKISDKAHESTGNKADNTSDGGERTLTEAIATYPDLANKSVAITGGASGIGAAIVTAFHEQGSDVIFFDKDLAEGNALANHLGDSVHFTELDLTDTTALAVAFNDASLRHDGFDVLINNAAMTIVLR